VKTNSLMSLRRSLSVTLASIGFLVLCLILAPVTSLAQNTISTFAGGGAFGTTATTLDLPGPSGAIRDTSGNTYIAAPYSTYVFKLSGTTVSSFAGLGYELYFGDGGLANKAGLDLPTALAIDGSGNIYIADPGGSRIRKVAAATGKISTVVGSGTKCEPSTGVCGDGGKATAPAVALNLPNAIAVDSKGNIYIADSADHRIRAVNGTSGTIVIAGVSIASGDIATIAGNGNICSSPTAACGDGAAATSAQLNFPEGIAVDSLGNIYIGDTRDNRIREIAAGSANITAFAGSGIACVSSSSPSCGNGSSLLGAEFHLPMGLFVDPNNNLYVADSFDQEVRFINVTAPSVSTVAGNGMEGFSGDSGLATSAELNSPGSVFLDTNSNLVISDTGNQRVRLITGIGGNISTLAGGGMGGDGGVASAATFANPYNVSEDSAGNLYIADSANNRIRAINTGTNTVTIAGVMIPPGDVATVAGNGNAGPAGNSGPATSATLNAPADVVVDSSGNIWIADTGNMVIREVLAATGVINTVAGSGLACLAPPSNCGDGGPALSGTLSDPLAIALDSAGNLYISDYTAQRVRKVTASTQIITTLAGIGMVGNKGDGGPANAAHLDHPLGLAVDASANVYIDDSQNNRVRMVASTTSNGLTAGYIYAFALSGAAHLQGDGGPKLLGGMWDPLELAIDPSGNLFIGGGNDSVVQRVDSISGTIGTVAGFLPKGTGGYSGDGGPATSAKLSNIGLWVDGQSNLYIADAGNNRVRLVHLTPAGTPTPTSLAFPATPLHQASSPMNVTFESTGGVDLDLSSITFGGKNPTEFSETDNCVSLVNLGVDVTCTVNVTFTPLSYALRTATMLFNDNGPGGSQSVSLSGYGPYFTPSMSPTSITVSQGSSGMSTVTVTPFGDFNGSIALSCAGAPTNTTCAISPTSVDLDGTGTAQMATLTFTAGATAAPGTYTMTITALFQQGGGQLQYSTTLGVTIP
jgi:sugar lactone lactonase YvrE